MDQPLHLKIIVVGDSGVGKTSFLNQYCYSSSNKSPAPTIGCDFSIKLINDYEGKPLRLQLWDIAGQERYNSISKLYIRGAIGCIVVADCTNEETMAAALRWKEVVEENCDLVDGDPIPILFMQNKSDKLEEGGERKDFQKIEYLNEFAKKHKFLKAYQVSVKSNVNLKESMNTLLSAILIRNSKKKIRRDNFEPIKRSSGEAVRNSKLSNKTGGINNSQIGTNGGACC